MRCRARRCTRQSPVLQSTAKPACPIPAASSLLALGHWRRQVSGEKQHLPPVPRRRADGGETASFIKTHVAHAFAGDNVNAGGAGCRGLRGEGLDQGCADAAAAEGSGEIDVQVGRKSTAGVGKMRAVVVKIKKPLLFGGIVEAANEVTGNGLTGERQQHSIAGVLEIAPQPTLQEGLALRPRLEAAAARLEKDILHLPAPRRWQAAADGDDFSQRARRRRGLRAWHGALPSAA